MPNLIWVLFIRFYLIKITNRAQRIGLITKLKLKPLLKYWWHWTRELEFRWVVDVIIPAVAFLKII